MNDVVGPPLAGGTVTTTDDGSTWVLQLPSMLASSAIYEVQVAGAQTPDGTSTLTTSWRFSVDGTGPPPKALTSLLAIAADSAVGLSWSVPVDFDRTYVLVLRAEGTLPPVVRTTPASVLGSFGSTVPWPEPSTVPGTRLPPYGGVNVSE